VKLVRKAIPPKKVYVFKDMAVGQTFECEGRVYMRIQGDTKFSSGNLARMVSIETNWSEAGQTYNIDDDRIVKPITLELHEV